ncbi:MAG: DUF11 domain-containing protein, partial [bacterium]|nr:DUF11 domain-containing protein [bacterium]
MVIVLSIGFTVAWQNPPPLSLTATAGSAVASGGETVTLTFTITNTRDTPLENVEITATVPQGTAFERAAADPGYTGQQWDIDLSGGVIRYQATGPLAADERAQVTLVVTVRPEAGESIVFETYEAIARGLEQPVNGEPVTIRVEATPMPSAQPTTPGAQPATPSVTQTPTPSVTQTPTPSVTQTPMVTVTDTVPAETPTLTATATPEPSPSPTATPEPTPTITVVVAELPPTPTPN